MKRKIAIFASGSGSNAENMIRYFNEREAGAVEVALVISNRTDAPVLLRAQRWHVPTALFLKEEWERGDAVLALLKEHKIDFVVLAGFLLRVPEAILSAYPHRIVNIHPALLPQYGGKGMYGNRVHEAVVAACEKESGITIHYANERYDEGDIIFQAHCRVLPTDTSDDVAVKVHALEHQHFPVVVEEVIAKVCQ